ncbi:RNA polymerase sigma factor (TIGR02999 family) [Paucibacter oligotrophus]|uniref:RNA polymerase sigma factor (TIGR02999 family) n=1 Tax=Roseateles oligotrophus TaxID=1769250 RepID=A0A840L918_9BURK|nr:RNA polymerase sigma factor (TIGR02999 family) [Roseateles oligotrophus]
MRTSEDQPPAARSDANEITVLLRAASAGDALAGERVISLLYADLQRLARSRLRQAGNAGGLTLLDPTGLVHESYLRLQQGGSGGVLDFPDRKHFLAYAARVMHNLVVDMVRAAQAQRHGGEYEHITLGTTIAGLPAVQNDAQILGVHEALQELAAFDPRLSQVVEMRYFGGLSEREIADSLGLTERTVQRDWQKARLYLSIAMQK